MNQDETKYQEIGLKQNFRFRIFAIILFRFLRKILRKVTKIDAKILAKTKIDMKIFAKTFVKNNFEKASSQFFSIKFRVNEHFRENKKFSRNEILLIFAHFQLFSLFAKMKKSTQPRAPLAHNKFYTLSQGYIKMMRLRSTIYCKIALF
jgi:hypothetical protein